MAISRDPKLREECEAKYKAKWKDKDGKDIILPWGNFGTDVHPDQCYRARNIDMEIKAHNFQTPTGQGNLLSEKAWTDLVGDMQKRQNTMDVSLEQKLALTQSLQKQEDNQVCKYAKTKPSILSGR